jgi:hypothetical protein
MATLPTPWATVTTSLAGGDLALTALQVVLETSACMEGVSIIFTYGICPQQWLQRAIILRDALFYHVSGFHLAGQFSLNPLLVEQAPLEAENAPAHRPGVGGRTRCLMSCTRATDHSRPSIWTTSACMLCD